MSNIRRPDAPPSLEAANQAQIDDLVQRNHALEFTNRKLTERLTVETERSTEVVLEIQRQWHEKEKAMREECEDFLAYYRFVQLGTVSALETERLNVLGEQKALRKEKLLRLQRDFRIAMFHAKERELEERVLELEEENEKIIIERKELASALRKKLAELIAQVRLKDEELLDLHSDRDVIEVDISNLREENAQLHASLASMTSKLERINLQLEGAHSSRSEQEGINEDLKHKNYDLQRQLDKWQRLENQGDAELESLRRRKNDLDAEVKELQDKLAKVTSDHAKALDKERKRFERLKETTLEWQESAEEHEKALKDAKKELTELRRELDKTKTQNDPVDSKPTPKPAKANGRSKKPFSVTDSETEREPSKRSGSASQRKNKTALESDADEIREVAPPPKASRKKKMSLVIEEDEAVDIVEESTAPPTPTKEKEVEVVKPKPRPKPKPKPRTRTIEIPDDEEPTLPPLLSTKTQRKRKASVDESDSDVESEKPDRKVAKTASKPERTRTTNSTAKKPPTRSPSEPPAGTATVVDPVQKQKKRKVINLFANPGSQSKQLGFEFDLGTGGLNLPTSLTPVRDADGPVPNRAISGVMSGVGNMIRGRMGVRR